MKQTNERMTEKRNLRSKECLQDSNKSVCYMQPCVCACVCVLVFVSIVMVCNTITRTHSLTCTEYGYWFQMSKYSFVSVLFSNSALLLFSHFFLLLLLLLLSCLVFFRCCCCFCTVYECRAVFCCWFIDTVWTMSTAWSAPHHIAHGFVFRCSCSGSVGVVVVGGATYRLFFFSLSTFFFKYGVSDFGIFCIGLGFPSTHFGIRNMRISRHTRPKKKERKRTTKNQR